MSSDGLLDPARPWIEDPRDLRGRQNWFATLLNPFGRSTALQFRRGWTAIFVARVLSIALPAVAALIGMLSGVSAQAAFLAAPVVFCLTVPMAFFLHLRRTADARRSGFWASLALAPVILGLGAAVGSASTTLPAAQEEMQRRVAERAQAQPADGEDASAIPDSATDGADQPSEAEAEPQQQQRGRRGGPPPNPVQQAMTQAGQTGFMVWALVGLIVAVWSLRGPGRWPSARAG